MFDGVQLDRRRIEHHIQQDQVDLRRILGIGSMRLDTADRLQYRKAVGVQFDGAEFEHILIIETMRAVDGRAAVRGSFAVVMPLLSP